MIIFNKEIDLKKELLPWISFDVLMLHCVEKYLERVNISTDDLNTPKEDISYILEGYNPNPQKDTSKDAEDVHSKSFMSIYKDSVFYFPKKKTIQDEELEDIYCKWNFSNYTIAKNYYTRHNKLSRALSPVIFFATILKTEQPTNKISKRFNKAKEKKNNLQKEIAEKELIKELWTNAMITKDLLKNIEVKNNESELKNTKIIQNAESMLKNTSTFELTVCDEKLPFDYLKTIFSTDVELISLIENYPKTMLSLQYIDAASFLSKLLDADQDSFHSDEEKCIMSMFRLYVVDSISDIIYRIFCYSHHENRIMSFSNYEANPLMSFHEFLRKKGLLCTAWYFSMLIDVLDNENEIDIDMFFDKSEATHTISEEEKDEVEAEYKEEIEEEVKVEADEKEEKIVETEKKEEDEIIAEINNIKSYYFDSVKYLADNHCLMLNKVLYNPSIDSLAKLLSDPYAGAQHLLSYPQYQLSWFSENFQSYYLNATSLENIANSFRKNKPLITKVRSILESIKNLEIELHKIHASENKSSPDISFAEACSKLAQGELMYDIISLANNPKIEETPPVQNPVSEEAL